MSVIPDYNSSLWWSALSIGDIGVCTHFVNLRHCGVGVDAKRWPKLVRYVEHVHARPSFKKVIEEEAPLFSA